jgi:hypothetical protein
LKPCDLRHSEYNYFVLHPGDYHVAYAVFL